MHQPVGIIVQKWLLKMGEQKDITINLRHLMDFGNGNFEINILNSNQIVHNMAELVPIAGLDYWCIKGESG